MNSNRDLSHPSAGCSKDNAVPTSGVRPTPWCIKNQKFTEYNPEKDHTNANYMHNQTPSCCMHSGNNQDNVVYDQYASGLGSLVPGVEDTGNTLATHGDEDRQTSQQEGGVSPAIEDEVVNPPCYLPQPSDDLIANDRSQSAPSGQHAGHHIDLSLGGTRFTVADWRMNNRHLLSRSCNASEHTNRNTNNCKNTMARAYAIIDKTQDASTHSVRDRSQLISKWKCTLERAIEAMIEEITALSEERMRLKQSLVVLEMPYSIATECLQIRCSRPESERIQDRPEEELYKELELIKRIRNILDQTLINVEAQQVENRRNRQRMEMDWSDKKDAHRIESLNASLNNHSTTTLFHAGATRFPAEQSSEEYWENFTKTILDDAEKCRQNSIALRSTLNEILINIARDLRNQADEVELAFTDRIACMEEIEQRLTNELKECLQKLADTENLIVKLQRSTSSLDSSMKVAQTRLDNRTERPNVENCRDKPQYSLVEEVGVIHNEISAMKAASDAAEMTKQMLVQTRTDLEKEIMLKRRTILLDKERCMLIRSHFPSATQLSGYAKV